MSYEVRLSPAARMDFQRLAEFLAEKNPAAARRAGDAILSALASLRETPERGRLVLPGHRELRIRFGRDGYVAQYRVDARHVVVARIFHAREQRYRQP